MALLTQANLAPTVGTVRVLPTVLGFDSVKRARSVVDESLPLLAETTHVVRTVLVVDVVESVRLIQEDEAGAVQRWRSFVDHVVHRLLPNKEGRLVKSLGDGLMLEFPRVHPAIDVAFAMQAASARNNEGVPADRRMRLRIGIHVSPLVADEHDVYGHGVNLAARLTTLAGPDEIVVSADVRDQLTPALDADVEDLGECYVKHVQQPVRAFRLGMPGEQPVIDAGSASQHDLRPTIAVIPFSARTADPQHDVLGQVVAEEVISAMSSSSDLHVVSRLSTTVFRGRDATLADVGTHLHADYVLSGSYYVDTDRLTLKAELAEARSGHIAWSRQLRGSIKAILAGHDDLPARLANESCAAMTMHEVQRAQTNALPTLEAYTLLLGGITLMHRLSPIAFERAQKMLQTIIDRAPRLATPYAWLAKWHVLRVQQGWSSDSERDARLALDHTKRALDHDPTCSLAMAIDGFVHANLLKRLDIALSRYELAISVNPNDSLAWLLMGTLHAFKGDGKVAVRNTRHAMKLSPLDPLRYFYESLAATAALSAKQYGKALELSRQSLRLNRTHTSTLRVQAVAQWKLDQYEEARATIRELLVLDPQFSVSRFLRSSPTGPYPLGQMAAEVFKQAGVPE